MEERELFDRYFRFIAKVVHYWNHYQNRADSARLPTDQALDEINTTLKKLHRPELPEDYRAFLRIVNGFSYLGHELYGTQKLVGCRDIVSENRKVGAYEALREYQVDRLYIGDFESNIHRYCYNAATRKYEIIKMVRLSNSEEMVEEYENFLELFLEHYAGWMAAMFDPDYSPGICPEADERDNAVYEKYSDSRSDLIPYQKMLQKLQEEIGREQIDEQKIFISPATETAVDICNRKLRMLGVPMIPDGYRRFLRCSNGFHYRKFAFFCASVGPLRSLADVALGEKFTEPWRTIGKEPVLTIGFGDDGKKCIYFAADNVYRWVDPKGRVLCEDEDFLKIFYDTALEYHKKQGL